MIELPEGIGGSFANRGYYGSVSHDVKAVYTFYLGFFDGNPATLHQLPPVEGARKTVEYMGGADAVLARARVDFEKGEYRWVAQAVNNVVFADPDNAEARELQADTLEQLGYQAENGTWRNFYLSAARELRDGVVEMAAPSTASPDLVRAMTTSMMLDYLGVRLNGPKAADRACDLRPRGQRQRRALPARGRQRRAEPHPGRHGRGAHRGDHADAAGAGGIVMGLATVEDLVAGGGVSIDGDAAAFADFLGMLDTFEFWFNIVTP